MFKRFAILLCVIMVLANGTKRGYEEPVPPLLASTSQPNKRSKMKHKCPHCDIQLSRLEHLYRHVRNTHTITLGQVTNATINAINDLLDYHSYESLDTNIRDALDARLAHLIKNNAEHTVRCSRFKNLGLLRANDHDNVATIMIASRQANELEKCESVCDMCDKKFKRPWTMYRHKRIVHPEPEANLHDSKLLLTDHAINGYVRTYEMAPNSPTEPISFLASSVSDIRTTLDREVKVMNGIKWFMTLVVEFKRARVEGEQTVEVPFQGGIERYLLGGSPNIEKASEKILEAIASYNEKGSGWVLNRVINIQLNVAAYDPIKGRGFFKLPDALRKNHAILNIENTDEYCFLWSILASRHAQKRRADSPHSVDNNRIITYKSFRNTLKTEGLNFPMELKDISKFEELNNIAVSVLGYDKKFYPLRISDRDCTERVTLMLVVNEEQQHYCLVTDLNMLLGKDSSHRKYHCPWCLWGFTREDLLAEHTPYCKLNGPQRIKMGKFDTIKFRNIHKQQRHPFVIYADFECLTSPLHIDEECTSTQRYQKHTPCAVAALLVGTDGTSELFNYRGLDAADQFLTKSEEWAKFIYEHTQNKIRMTTIDWIRHKLATKCHICGEEFKDGETKTADHDHSGSSFNYRGTAHKNCNLRFKLTRNIPVVFHNLKGYDAHIIVKAVAKAGSADACQVIAKNIESYIGFTVKIAVGVNKNQKVVSRNLMFIDSLAFLGCSLSTLTENLVKSNGAFSHLRNHSTKNDLLKRGSVDLLLAKGVYPYDFASSMSVFDQTTLPAHSDFFNRLNNCDISLAEYEHATHVFDQFKIRSFGEYTDLYVLTDVLLLADVFESFRNVVNINYGLDPCHYYSTPGLSWDAMLNYTNIKLEALKDPTMYGFFEAGMRGGVSSIMHRYARANHPDMPSYDSSKPNSFISYLDKNNLYGHSMSQDLPVNGFEWIDELPSELKPCGQGYILEVDLEYPDQLHSTHSSFPLAPEHKCIKVEQLSPYCKDIIANDFGKKSSQKKLIPHLGPRRNYILHSSNLALYVSLGMIVTKFHRGLKFNTSRWLKPYIALNTRLRQAAQNEFESSLYKLFNNAVFGKTCENTRRYADVKLCSSVVINDNSKRL